MFVKRRPSTASWTVRNRQHLKVSHCAGLVTRKIETGSTKGKLFILRLGDESPVGPANLPDPDVLATEIVDGLGKDGFEAKKIKNFRDSLLGS